MDIKGWAARHNANVVKDSPRRSRIALFIGSAIWCGLAVLLVAVALDEGGGAGGLGGFAVPVLLAAGLSAWMLWRATRFRMAHDAAQVGGTLTLSAARWNVTLDPSDVEQVVQQRRNPFGSGFYNVDNPAWGAWVRIDARSGSARTRKYLVWRQDAPAFLEQLRSSGFPLVGPVVPVTQPS